MYSDFEPGWETIDNNDRDEILHESIQSHPLEANNPLPPYSESYILEDEAVHTVSQKASCTGVHWPYKDSNQLNYRRIYGFGPPPEDLENMTVGDVWIDVTPGPGPEFIVYFLSTEDTWTCLNPFDATEEPEGQRRGSVRIPTHPYLPGKFHLWGSTNKGFGWIPTSRIAEMVNTTPSSRGETMRYVGTLGPMINEVKLGLNVPLDVSRRDKRKLTEQDSRAKAFREEEKKAEATGGEVVDPIEPKTPKRRSNVFPDDEAPPSSSKKRKFVPRPAHAVATMDNKDPFDPEHASLVAQSNFNAFRTMNDVYIRSVKDRKTYMEDSQYERTKRIKCQERIAVLEDLNASLQEELDKLRPNSDDLESQLSRSKATIGELETRARKAESSKRRKAREVLVLRGQSKELNIRLQQVTASLALDRTENKNLRRDLEMERTRFTETITNQQKFWTDMFTRTSVPPMPKDELPS